MSWREGLQSLQFQQKCAGPRYLLKIFFFPIIITKRCSPEKGNMNKIHFFLESNGLRKGFGEGLRHFLVGIEGHC